MNVKRARLIVEDGKLTQVVEDTFTVENERRATQLQLFSEVGTRPVEELPMFKPKTP